MAQPIKITIDTSNFKKFTTYYRDGKGEVSKLKLLASSETTVKEGARLHARTFGLRFIGFTDENMKETTIFEVTENGFSMAGDNKVSVPACKIKASSYIEAAGILDEFLSTRIKPDAIELITPIERIDFES